MKKLLSIAAVTVALVSLSSCKKDYTCECTSTIGGQVLQSVSTTINGKKSDVKESCENGSSSQTIGGVTTSVSCTIKD